MAICLREQEVEQREKDFMLLVNKSNEQLRGSMQAMPIFAWSHEWLLVTSYKQVGGPVRTCGGSSYKIQVTRS